MCRIQKKEQNQTDRFTDQLSEPVLICSFKTGRGQATPGSSSGVQETWIRQVPRVSGKEESRWVGFPPKLDRQLYLWTVSRQSTTVVACHESFRFSRARPLRRSHSEFMENLEGVEKRGTTEQDSEELSAALRAETEVEEIKQEIHEWLLPQSSRGGRFHMVSF